MPQDQKHYHLLSELVVMLYSFTTGSNADSDVLHYHCRHHIYLLEDVYGGLQIGGENIWTYISALEMSHAT